MYTVSLSFSDYEAKKMLEGIGLDIRFQDMEFNFSSKEECPENEAICVWVVINPYTNKPELLQSFIERLFERIGKTRLITIDNKLDIYNLFSKKYED